MTLRSVTYLKAVFETGDIPTGTDYSDVFDSFVSLHSSAEQTMQGALNLPGLTSTSPIVRNYVSANGSGTTQSAAKQVSADVCFLHVAASGNRAFRLENYALGRTQHLINNSSSVTAATIYPSSAINFLGTAANAPILLGVNQTLIVNHVGTSAYSFGRS